MRNTCVRPARRARVLLLADADDPEGRRTDTQIAAIVGLTEKQVKRIRWKFVAEGPAATTTREARSDAGTRRTLDGRAEAQLVALCCSEPPAGRQRWTLRLLVDELCRLQVVAEVCPETVWRRLKKTASSPGSPGGSASRAATAPGSWPGWRRSSTSTPSRSTRPIR
ncbi:MAG TPA: helix-turn-helix domain-containing protein [Isosphaeraceae bacterium]|nr:helix-turn-helix domain-containing protein [Isosphaeraceae bacterium]